MYHHTVIFSVIVSFAFAINLPEFECGNSSSSKSNDWDYLTYAQHWPASFCLSQSSNCSIPADVKFWTVHGLWPSALNGDHPQYCYHPQKFNVSGIETLIGQLNHTWPNLIPEDPFTSFWQHEWCKHGTCGENSPEIKGEPNYFKKGLALNEKISIDSALESENIFPGKNYSLSSITNAIYNKFKVTGSVLCFHDSVKNQSVLQQVEICMNKKFELMNCPGSTKLKNKRLTSLGTCSSKHDLFYPPLKEYSIVIH